MELDAFERGLGFVSPDPSHPHNDLDLFAIDLVIAGRGDLPAIFSGRKGRDGCGLDDERVVPGDGRGGVDAREEALRVVVDFGGFAVHKYLVACDGHAVAIGHALVPQADTQHGDLPREVFDDGAGNPRFFGGTWAGRDDDMARAFAVVELGGLFWGDLVVAFDDEIAIGL